MNNKNKILDEKEKLMNEIKEISIFEDLNDPNIIEKISKIKNEIQELDSKLDSNNIETNNSEGYYETMSVTYIDDNGTISEVYRINDEVVTKEAFDDWSYDYFNVIKKQKEAEEAEKIKNEILELEKKLTEKKERLSKSGAGLSKPIPDIRDSKSSNLSFYNNRSLRQKNPLIQSNISNSQFFKK